MICDLSWVLCAKTILAVAIFRFVLSLVFCVWWVVWASDLHRKPTEVNIQYKLTHN